jgi:hypothetical protein
MPTEVLTDEDVDQLLKTAAGLGQWLVGLPAAEAMVLLDQSREHLRTELSLRFGADVADVIVRGFAEAVISCKRELENSRTSGVN